MLSMMTALIAYSAGLGLVLIFAWLILAQPVQAQSAQSAQSAPSWEDIAVKAQESATMNQLSANAIIATLEAELKALKAELAKHAPERDPGFAAPKPVEKPGG